MKIVFRISSLGFGGAEQVFLSLAKQFVYKPDMEILFLVDKENGENIKTAKELGFTVHSLNVKRTASSIIPLKKFIEQEKPDIILSAYTDTNAACLIGGTLSKHKPKIIVSEHASLKEHWKNKPMLKRFLLNFYVSYVYRLSSCVICVSNGLKSQVTTLLGNSHKIKTIYNPVRFTSPEVIEKKVYCSPAPTLKLLAVGRICEPKNYETLLRAVALISKSRACELKIVGGIFCHKEYEKLQSNIAELGIERLVSFEGYSENVADFYKNADIFVLSSAWEGFGNVIVEAMSFGVPIVSTNCNFGPSEILENGKYGRLVPVGDYVSLAEAIFDELEKPTIPQKQLIERSKDFSEQVIASQYFEIITGVLNEKI